MEDFKRQGMVRHIGITCHKIGVAEEWAYVLRKAGYNLIADIAEEKPQGLQQKLLEINKKYKLGYEKPSLEEIGTWIEKANN